MNSWWFIILRKKRFRQDHLNLRQTKQRRREESFKLWKNQNVKWQNVEIIIKI